MVETPSNDRKFQLYLNIIFKLVRVWPSCRAHLHRSICFLFGHYGFSMMAFGESTSRDELVGSKCLLSVHSVLLELCTTLRNIYIRHGSSNSFNSDLNESYHHLKRFCQNLLESTLLKLPNHPLEAE